MAQKKIANVSFCMIHRKSLESRLVFLVIVNACTKGRKFMFLYELANPTK